ncbi:MAG TPA: response regulator [Polyangia bacterium]|nr:response regulator [Polyangia bacterium]
MSNPRVLVVEPNVTLRQLIRAALEGEGYVVLSVADGGSALLERERFSPDVVVQDLMLPDMAGLELTRRLRAAAGGDSLPILAVSGFLGGVQAAKVAAVGFSALLLKPLDPRRVIQAVNAQIPAGRHRPPDIGKSRRILVVDDDPVQQRLLTYQLEAAGFRVNTASSGEGALQSARVDPPDAVVSDVLMPGTDGFELCLEIRRDQALARIPVLLLSFQYIEQDDLDLAERVGATRFVQRPSRSRELVQAVLEILSHDVTPVPTDAIDLLNRAHVHRVNRQLGRQVTLGTRLAQTSAIQASQLSLLGGMADTLSRGGSVDGVLDDVLPGCLDAAGISKGALYLAGAGPADPFTCRRIVGFRPEDDGSLAGFFGCPAVLQQVLSTGVPMRLPSAMVPRDITRRVLGGANAKTALVVPLGSEQPRVGVLFAASDTPAENGSAPIAFVKALGGQIGQAMALANSFSQLTTALAMRDEFLTVAAHELRTPLTAARLQVQGLSRELEDAHREPAASARTLPAKVSMIGRQLMRLEGLVDLMLDASRTAADSLAARRECADLAELVRATISLCHDDASGGTPPITLSASGPVIGWWDRAALELVMRNLLSNAVKFSGNQPVEVSIEQVGECAVMSVRDHGIGIAVEDRERIFGKFERAVATRNYGGWGIGLWLARRYVSAHGGTIRVESQPNDGATFIVELPLGTGADPAAARPSRRGHDDPDPTGLFLR